MVKGIKKAFLIAALSLCSFIAAIFGVGTLSVSAESTVAPKRITATTSASVTQGNYGYLYVYIDSLSGLSALDVSVHFDSEKVSVTSVYNSVTADVYDNVTNQDNVKFSYIFKGEGSTSNTRLFYVYYKVLATAEAGETYFDIVVGDAYDPALNTVSVSGSRCTFTVTEKVTTKSCTVSSTSSISTSVKGEFSLAYRLSTYQIASGSVNITYDPELFEVVGVTNGAFLSNKVADVNTNLAGTVYVSFVGTEYVSKYDFITITFKTLKNVTESSGIKFAVTEFYDKDLNLVSCNGYTTTANVVFDDTYTEDSPSMIVSAEYSAETKQVTAKIKLASDSHLGAGDFTLTFDTSVLTFVSYEQGFSPSFFNVNDKEVTDGKLKFSIISMEDIVTEETVLTVVFDTAHSCVDIETAIGISGNGLADSLTNSILLNFVDASVVVPLKHFFGDWETVTAATSLTVGEERRDCANCDVFEVQEIAPLGVILDSEINFGHSCSFHNNLTMNYYVPTGDLTAYESFYLYVEKDVYTDGVWSVETTTLQGELTSTGWKFVFKGIAAAEAGNEIRAILYAQVGDMLYKSETDVYSVKTYAYSRLEKSTDEEFKTLLVDMLNYCAAAQTYFGVNVENLVNADLTDEQIALATQTDAVVADTSSTVTLEGSTAKIVGKSIVFNSNIEVKFYMDLSAYTDLTGLALKIVYSDESGEEYVENISADEFIYDASTGYYTVKYNSLNSAELRALMTVEILFNGNVVSDTVRYSVETYVYNRLSQSTDKNFKVLLNELMKYSDSAKNYFY